MIVPFKGLGKRFNDSDSFTRILVHRVHPATATSVNSMLSFRILVRAPGLTLISSRRDHLFRPFCMSGDTESVGRQPDRPEPGAEETS